MMDQHDMSICHNEQNTNRDTVLIQLKQITDEFIDNAVKNTEREKLLDCHNRLIDTLMRVWNEVEQGTLKIDCKAMLRSICNITCPDLLTQINSMGINKAQLIRELRLLSNTIKFIF